ncbi:putative wall-associated receptor kinase, galacturonan-binding domain-containing protein [Helianthus anomalus]
MCGDVRIPFPFGIGASCSINSWYNIDCNSSRPYLVALNHLEVLGVNLKSRTLNVSMPKISYCPNPVQNSSKTIGLDLRRSPFWVSNSDNKFVFEGCGTAAIYMDNGSVLAACSTTCRGDTHSDRNTCFGFGCCQTIIPNNYIKSYRINITGLDGDCGSAFLVEEERFFNPLIFRSTSSIPISLVWTLTASDQLNCCYNNPPRRYTMDMYNGATVDAWYCDGYFLEGNPFLVDGCVKQEGDHTEECRRCEDGGGDCQRERMYDVEGSVISESFTCHHYNRTSLRIILGNVFSLYIFFQLKV